MIPVSETLIVVLLSILRIPYVIKMRMRYVVGVTLHIILRPSVTLRNMRNPRVSLRTA